MPTWLMNAWVQRAALALVALMALLGVRQYYIAKGRAAGREIQKIETQDYLERTRTQDRAQAVASIEDHRKAAQEARQRADAAEAEVQALSARVKLLAAQRAAADAQVARVPDAELMPRLTGALSLRAPEEKSPELLPEEARELLRCVSALPICEKQVEAQAAQLAKNLEQLDAVQAESRAVRGQYDALSGYTTRLETAYTELWNLHPKRRRSPVCLWLWHCRATKLTAPDPRDLLRK